MPTRSRSVVFTGPRSVEVREGSIPDIASDEVRIRTIASAISPGTELLVYRGDAPTGVAVDETIDALPDTFAFPLAYGYAAVGRVTAVGEDVDNEWLERTVFAFHPHESHFAAVPDDLVPVPEGIPLEVAAFLANVESAVNFLMDGRPVIGERVAIFGQGIVGLLTTALLSSYPLESLVTVDLHKRRREFSEAMGADEALDPDETDVVERLRNWDRNRDRVQDRAVNRDDDPGPNGTDLAYELTGEPDALNDAIDAMAYDSRLVVGSWYGEKPAELYLGGRFHRNRGELVSSQVSSIDPRYRGRWSKARRLEVAWGHLAALDPRELITHRIPIERAPEAYRLLDERPQEAVQVLLTYD